ncbi:aspartic peptidase domain-containing protein [Fennellomyces sp. T-0311]|nr:aspartic peptidase domain-containing protein [Fennellomyces sp. T-0311]
MLLSTIGLALAAVTSSVVMAIEPIIIPIIRNSKSHDALFGESYIEIPPTGIERLYNYGGTGYMFELGIGTPPQKFNMTLDTGSGTTWVASTDCSKSVCTMGRFNISASTSGQATDMPFNIKYGIGDARGTYFLETVTVANLTISNQSIALVNETSGIFPKKPSSSRQDGIAGFGFPGMNYLKGYEADIPFVFGLAYKKLIPEPIFSIYLNSQFEHQYSGEIMLGGIDESKYTGSLTYAPVVPYVMRNRTTGLPFRGYVYWTLGGTGVKTSTGLDISFDKVENFVLDTGATLSYGPKEVTDQIAQSIAGVDSQQLYDKSTGLYHVDCGLSSRNETIEFTVATDLQSPSSNPLNLTISVREMLIPNQVGVTPEQATSGCILGIAAMPITFSSSRYVLGDSVLRSLYTVYDMSQSQVGIAPAIFGA